MLKIAGILLVLAVIALCLLAACGTKPLRRGLIASSFVSTGRPALVFTPAGGFKPNASGLTDVSPEADKGFPSARAWYALYSGGNATAAVLEVEESETTPLPLPGERARLVFLLSEVTHETWKWDLDARPASPAVRAFSDSIGPFNFEEATFVLSPGLQASDPRLPADPFGEFFTDPGPPWRRGSLVRRYTALPEIQRVKIIIEYREPLPAGFEATTPNVQDFLPLDLLLAFERRALAAFTLSDAVPGNAADTIQTPLSPPESFSRRALGAMLGLLRSLGES